MAKPGVLHSWSDNEPRNDASPVNSHPTTYIYIRGIGRLRKDLVQSVISSASVEGVHFHIGPGGVLVRGRKR